MSKTDGGKAKENVPKLGGRSKAIQYRATILNDMCHYTIENKSCMLVLNDLYSETFWLVCSLKS